jgi:hypothetical protein
MTTDAEHLFPAEPLGGSSADIYCRLDELGVLRLAYDEETGRNPGYLFRGELNYKTPLQSTLERLAIEGSESVTRSKLMQCEREIAACFFNSESEGRRVATLIAEHGNAWPPPPAIDVFWWLSLMQHYGHETRLIDFTRQVRVALFFALEQYFKKPSAAVLDDPRKRQLVIYCLPCHNENNKLPFGPIEGKQPDMNKALGCAMELADMEPHQENFKKFYRPKFKQSWGWDRPKFENARLRFQKGMFAYPYDDPSDASQFVLKTTEGSWLCQNLKKSGKNAADPFNVKVHRLESRRIIIDVDDACARKLYQDLKHPAGNFNLTPATVYVDFEKVGTKPGL